MDACRCPLGQTFRTGQGCADDSSCADADLCRAGRGTWHPEQECYCGFTCGLPNPCGACLDSCNCGPHRTFTSGQGCLPDAACTGAQEEEICVSTGGFWNGCSAGFCSCGHHHCGQPHTLEPCIAPGCDCGPLANFDAEQGCVLDSSCTRRNLGEECSGYGLEWSSCRPGLTCCDSCGIPPGCRFCENPCCPGDPSCDQSTGCYPPPP